MPVNLARTLADGQQIVIPTQDEYAKATAWRRHTERERSGQRRGQPRRRVAENPGAPSAGTVLNINTADAAALDALPGVGPSRLPTVADRDANGPFVTPDDLGRVSGIGPKKLDALRDFIRVQ